MGSEMCIRDRLNLRRSHARFPEKAAALSFPTGKIIIATRESALALWQAKYIRQRLIEHYPGLQVEILGMLTQGDRLLSASLAKVGGKGLFVKELERALEDRRADIAVHSMKDVPMELPPGFLLPAVTEREDPRDAFVSLHYPNLPSLPAGARVILATSGELHCVVVARDRRRGRASEHRASGL